MVGRISNPDLTPTRSSGFGQKCNYEIRYRLIMLSMQYFYKEEGDHNELQIIISHIFTFAYIW